MFRSWRRWIATVLMVTLPLQAAVAAAGLCCPPAGTAERSTVAPAAAAHAGAAPCHQADDRVDDRADAASAASADAVDDSLGSDRCHACAACAMGVALPAGEASLPAAAVAASPQVGSPAPATLRAAAPPEPPPRA